jgi:tRNA(fMet)-specific endonuclease VapC
MSVRFMLDTDTVSYAWRGHGGVKDRIAAHGPDQLCISAVTLSELLFGAARRESARLNRYLAELTRDVLVMPFDQRCAVHYARIANDLAARGEPIGALDTMIAAHALTLDLTLVTNNVRHFTRVQNLKVENWA